MDEKPDKHHCSALALSSEHMCAARVLVLRVGGATAASQFARLLKPRYPKPMQPLVAGVAERLKAEELLALAHKRDRVTVPSSKEHTCCVAQVQCRCLRAARCSVAAAVCAHD